MTVAQKFDGLAEEYDRHRPRYPDALLSRIAAAVPAVQAPLVIDTGAGSGIVLEGLLAFLPADARVEAVDISGDMVERGRAKFPQVGWTVGEAEPYLETARGVSLVVAGQAYQWMDRPRYLRAVRECLGEGGVLAVIQNNRDFSSSAFLDAYETLLEELSPGYSRFYRSFDIPGELGEVLAGVESHRANWVQPMDAADFLAMTRSSTQVQRAIAAHGEQFGDRVRELTRRHGADGRVEVAYTSELFLARRPAEER